MTITHFSLLNIPLSFEIDLKALESAYFTAQRQYHPDRFVGKPDSERLAALQRSADINKAYETLKNPLKRAQYLLHLQGITVGTEQDSVKPSQELLLETLQWNEALESNDNRSKLMKELTLAYANSVRSIADHFRAFQWNKMAQEVLRLGYIIKTIQRATL